MSLADDLQTLRTGAGVVERGSRGHVVVRGPDGFSFLQALVSADLDALGDGDGTACLLLAPQGKLDVVFRLLRVGDEAWLDTDPGLGLQLAASLSRFKIRVDADVVDRSDSWAMVSLLGADVDARFGGPHPVGVHTHEAFGSLRVVRTPFGLDLVGERVAVRAAVGELVDDGWPVAPAAAYDAFRIEHGIPVQPLDIDDSTIPQEAELELDAVSFTKGCFLGQELVCRIDTRGHVNRFLRRLVDVEGDRPEVGTEVVVGDKVVGAVTSVTPDGVPPVALASVRREIDPGTRVELRGPTTAATASVEARRPAES